MPNRVAHFEIHVQDPERAIQFYTSVFGWDIQKWQHDAMEYWMIMTGERDEQGGINGGLVRRSGAMPAQDAGANAFVCTVIVENFDAIAEKILAAGGSVATPKFSLAGMAWQGNFFDPEGNTFGVHEVITGVGSGV